MGARAIVATPRGEVGPPSDSYIVLYNIHNACVLPLYSLVSPCHPCDTARQGGICPCAARAGVSLARPLVHAYLCCAFSTFGGRLGHECLLPTQHLLLPCPRAGVSLRLLLCQQGYSSRAASTPLHGAGLVSCRPLLEQIWEGRYRRAPPPYGRCRMIPLPHLLHCSTTRCTCPCCLHISRSSHLSIRNARCSNLRAPASNKRLAFHDTALPRNALSCPFLDTLVQLLLLPALLSCMPVPTRRSPCW